MCQAAKTETDTGTFLRPACSDAEETGPEASTKDLAEVGKTPRHAGEHTQVRRCCRCVLMWREMVSRSSTWAVTMPLRWCQPERAASMTSLRDPAVLLPLPTPVFLSTTLSKTKKNTVECFKHRWENWCETFMNPTEKAESVPAKTQPSRGKETAPRTCPEYRVGEDEGFGNGILISSTAQ